MKKQIGNVITDIVLVGSVDSAVKPVEITINHEYLYLELDGQKWVKLFSVEQMSALDVTEVLGLEFSFEIDEDDEYISVSVRDLVLIDTISNVSIARVDEYSAHGKNKALELFLENGQSIFIDSTYYTGIKVGEEALKRVFIENHKGYVKR